MHIGGQEDRMMIDQDDECTPQFVASGFERGCNGCSWRFQCNIAHVCALEELVIDKSKAKVVVVRTGLCLHREVFEVCKRSDMKFEF